MRLKDGMAVHHFPLQKRLRIHFLLQWFTLSDPAIEKSLHGVPLSSV